MRFIIGKRLVMKHFGVCNVKDHVRKDKRLRLITAMRPIVNTSLLMGKLSVLKVIPLYA